MSSKKSAVHGIITMRCPRCRDGKMFPNGTLYSKHFMKMNARCNTCDQSFMPEPGYYFGAMFVSYALNTVLFVAVWLGLIVFEQASGTLMLIVMITVVFALLPVTFRLSRVLWIYIFVRYEKNLNLKS